jgi:hypothetical protein
MKRKPTPKTIENAAAVPPDLPKMDVERMNAALDKLAAMGKGMPVLSDYATSREGIYEDDHRSRMLLDDEK